MYRTLALLPLIAVADDLSTMDLSTNEAFTTILQSVPAEKIPCFTKWTMAVMPTTSADLTLTSLCEITNVDAVLMMASETVTADPVCVGAGAVTAEEFKATIGMYINELCADSSAVSVSLIATLAALALHAL